MESILNEIESRLEDMRMMDLARRIRLIHKAYAGKDWRLCVMGAFSRGKTHLLNLLLDSELLPEDILPATTVLTEISYAPQIKAEFVDKEGIKPIPANNESLSRYSSGNECADADGILKIGLPCDFLKPNLVLYDTPGMDDLLELRADRVFEALEFCDTALIVVSAISPLGLNERQFITEYLHKRENPRLALVVSFLDQLDKKSQEKLLYNIIKSARHIYPEIEIWSAMPNLPKSLCDVSGIENMRIRIRQWAEDPANMRLKKEQERRDIGQVLELEIRLEEESLKQLERDESATQAKLHSARQSLHEQGRDWAEIRNNLLDASLENLESLQKYATQEIKSMVEEKREIYASRAILREATEKLALAAQKIFNEDVARALAEIRKSYGLSPDLGRGISFSAVEINEELCPYLSKNNESIRLLLDLMDRHAGEIILWLPLPVIGQRIARELARRFLVAARKKFDDPEQRMEAYRHSILSATDDLHKMLREAYAGIAEKILELREQWLNNAQAGLEARSEGRNLKEEMSLRANNIKELKSMLAELAIGTAKS